MTDRGIEIAGREQGSVNDTTLICDNCEEPFDHENEGHTDENTDLSFCGAVCEMYYDREIGIPENYEFPLNKKGNN